ncbi:RimJ/RimL family protein N-acetyltransferase [Sphingopyxis panaciterrae]|uniref:GNAT family N-acetyltransferase n=1 Tax=Sphingopyxis panaciterrae TaxID=363841 RepID=UPI001420DE1D|nr:RimJ/RimL family protein N-acetyltransferase [Sphingopyxis panaciterrae]
MTIAPLATARLHLLPLTLDDAPAIQRIFPKWEILRWMGGSIPWPYPANGAKSFLKGIALPAMARGEAWHWSIRPKSDIDRLIGIISLGDIPDDNRGFWLSPDWQGQGLMTEASDAVTAYWFETLGRTHLRVPKAANNPASRRISERQGMRVIDRFRKTLVSGEQDMELWEITRDEWRVSQHAPRA